MDHFVYLLLTRTNNKYISYVGYTNNLKDRLKKHNSSKGAKFTKGRTWKIIYKKKDDFFEKVSKSDCLVIFGVKVS